MEDHRPNNCLLCVLRRVGLSADFPVSPEIGVVGALQRGPGRTTPDASAPPGARQPIRKSSKVKLQSKLNDARISRLRNLTEIAVESEMVRIKELGMIEGIEEFRTEFNGLAFG